MTKQNEQETLEVAMSRTGDFFERNSKTIIIVMLSVFVAAALIFGYKKLIAEPRVAKAAEMIAEAQYRFESETPDYELALNGDENGAGFLDVIAQYGSTPAGNLAKQYAGICYLKIGDLDKAAEYLAKYSNIKGLPGALINAQNLGLQGDIAVEKGDYATAVKFYDKAIKAADNNLTAPMYLRKAGMALNAMGDKDKAAEYYQKIIDNYPSSAESREVEKYIGTTI